jgi:putative peptidoglycan lipid II flippase
MGTEKSWLQMSFVDRTIHLAWLVPLGATAYFATLWILGFRPGDFKRRAAT